MFSFNFLNSLFFDKKSRRSFIFRRKSRTVAADAFRKFYKFRWTDNFHEFFVEFHKLCNRANCLKAHVKLYFGLKTIARHQTKFIIINQELLYR